MIDYAALDSTIGHNWYDLDPLLDARIARDVPSADREWATSTLRELGSVVGGRIAPNADVIDANPPRLNRYDRWANEVGDIEHHPATLDSKRALWDSGYVSGFAGAERTRGRSTPGSVIAAAHYLVSQADTGLVCSLGMTSGVAGLVDAYAPPDLRDDLLAALRADDADHGADGSMFLTERDGGSDLGRTVHCTARDLGDGRVLINGEKWFCSNIDGAAIVLLARPEGADEGPSNIGLYLVPRIKDDGSRNGIVMRRLKAKLGTKSVPTGEVEFRDALGYALRPRRANDTAAGLSATSDAGGLNRMMEMVNGSRFGVAMMGLGIARRSLLESLVWAHHRQAKGRLLVDLPLVREQLVDLLVEHEAAFALGFECATASRFGGAGTALRRILVPMAKIRLTRFGVEAATTAIELHGGNGYCEDWGLTRQLRDAICHPIWEGTEHICRLDVLRAIRRTGAHEALIERIDAARGARLQAERDAAVERIEALDGVDADRAEAWSAPLTAQLIELTSAALLLERARETSAPRDELVAERYVRRHFAPQRLWDDQIAAVAGRALLAYASIDSPSAQHALT